MRQMATIQRPAEAADPEQEARDVQGALAGDSPCQTCGHYFEPWVKVRSMLPGWGDRCRACTKAHLSQVTAEFREFFFKYLEDEDY